MMTTVMERQTSLKGDKRTMPSPGTCAPCHNHLRLQAAQGIRPCRQQLPVLCCHITKCCCCQSSNPTNRNVCKTWPCSDLSGKEVILHPCLPWKPLVQRHLHKACAKHRHSFKVHTEAWLQQCLFAPGASLQGEISL